MADVIIDAAGLHIRHIEPAIECPEKCPHCGGEIEPEFVDCMAAVILGGISPKEMPDLPPQSHKVRIIIQDEGEQVY